MSRFHVWTIGCQMNQADSWKARESLAAMGHEPVNGVREADLVILNTCVVRQNAEDKVVARLASLKSFKDGANGRAIVVMGCFVGDELALRQRFPHVDVFLPPSDVDGLAEFVRRWSPDTKQPFAVGLCSGAPVAALMPISYGCDHRCTYCIVRLRRGPERSRPVDEVVREVRSLVSAGAVEVTLLGQNVDSYGGDLPGKPDLADLLGAVHDIEGLERIRFLTSHPGDMDFRIIQSVADLPKVCEHFELPAQSGDDLILKRMGRRYTAHQFRGLVERIREVNPGASIATDVIVGFPGEGREHYSRTVRLVQELRFDSVHIAAYSPRPGTPASRLPDDVPTAEKERRRRYLEDVQERIAAEINHRLLGQSVEILVDERRKGKWKGRTRTNKLVFFESDTDWLGELVDVEITWTGPWSMQGRVGTAQEALRPLSDS